MNVPIFIGDELTASGFRLGGARVRVVDESDVEVKFRDAREGAEPILITARCANLLPSDVLDAALVDLEPLVVIVPDAFGTEPPDVAKHVRRTLDLELS
jgi:vacuolar-type H+-ATPase subunit F/Vma7